ncbi:MAG: HPF/RaiA family ribosome-associated protein [Christensenellales bacterium]
MKIEVFGKNYNPSDSLKAITEKKCAKLERRFDDDAEVRFNVTYENGDYTTDMVLTTKGLTYRATAQSGSPFDNLDEVIPRLLGQVRKQKDIWGKDKKGTPNEYAEETVDDEE